MSYRLKLTEPVEQGVRRIAAQQLRRTIEELSALAIEPATIHGSRKSIKRVRALLRLVEPVISKRAFGPLNTQLRDAGRRLAGSRDGTVIETTLRQLAADETLTDEVRASLATLAAKAAQCTSNDPAVTDVATQEATARLIKVSKKISKLRVKGNGFEALAPGLQQSYRRARNGAKAAYAYNTDDAFHDLRKAVQWHWRQMNVLMQVWPDECQVRAAQAREISHTLGRDHDLAMVRDFAKHAGLDPTAFKAVREMIAQQQAALRLNVRASLDQLLAEKPKALVDRFEAYWAASAAHAERQQAAQPVKARHAAGDDEKADILAAPVASEFANLALERQKSDLRANGAPRLKKAPKSSRQLAAKTPGAGGSPETV